MRQWAGWQSVYRGLRVVGTAALLCGAGADALAQVALGFEAAAGTPESLGEIHRNALPYGNTPNPSITIMIPTRQAKVLRRRFQKVKDVLVINWSPT